MKNKETQKLSFSELWQNINDEKKYFVNKRENLRNEIGILKEHLEQLEKEEVGCYQSMDMRFGKIAEWLNEQLKDKGIVFKTKGFGIFGFKNSFLMSVDKSKSTCLYNCSLDFADGENLSVKLYFNDGHTEYKAINSLNDILSVLEHQKNQRILEDNRIIGLYKTFDNYASDTERLVVCNIPIPWRTPANLAQCDDFLYVVRDNALFKQEYTPEFINLYFSKMEYDPFVNSSLIENMTQENMDLFYKKNFWIGSIYDKDLELLLKKFPVVSEDYILDNMKKLLFYSQYHKCIFLTSKIKNAAFDFIKEDTKEALQDGFYKPDESPIREMDSELKIKLFENITEKKAGELFDVTPFFVTLFPKEIITESMLKKIRKSPKKYKKLIPFIS